MADFAYGVSSFERARGNFPALPVVNMLAEVVNTEPNTVLQSRPGLKTSGFTVGNNGIDSIFTADKVLGNSLFLISGSTLYRDGVEVGAIDGDGPISWAAYEDTVFVTAGESIWKYNNDELSVVSFPDGVPVSKILVAGSRLIAVRKDTGIFYWTDPLDFDIDLLSFATAENLPDRIVDALLVGDRIIFFGAESVEFWQIVDDQGPPFSPLIGATLPVGCKVTGTAVPFSRSFAWTTNWNEICLGDPDNIISEPELQVKIENSFKHKLWVFYVDNNEYLAVTLDEETWVYGARSKVWSKFESFGQPNWVCQCYDGGYFGTTLNGWLVQWSDDYADFGGFLERKFRAWSPLTSDVEFLSNVILRTNPGTTEYTSGPYSDPIVELRTSLDGGHTWQPWRPESLGSRGNYRVKTIWSSLGQFSYPGFLAEVRVTDPVPFRVSGLQLNEPFGGV